MRRALLPVLIVAACHDVPTVPPVAASLTVLSGSGQGGVPGYLLGVPIKVRLLDDRNNPVAGDTINFTLGDASGLLDPDFAVTDSAGMATTQWRLGGALGTQTLSARAVAIPAVSAVTVSVSASSNFVKSIDGGYYGLCAVNMQGQLGCWIPPRLRLANPSMQFVPAAAPVQFKQVIITKNLTNPRQGCALAESGRPWCFTMNLAGGVDGLAELAGAYPAFTQIVGADEIASYCGLAADGQAWCWGVNSDGQLGDGTITTRTAPVAVATSARFVQIDMDNHACAVTSGGEAWCWGRNHAGETGVSAATSPVTVPQLVSTSFRFSKVKVDAYAQSSCGFVADGTFACWGHIAWFGAVADKDVQFATTIPKVIATASRPVDMFTSAGAHFILSSGAQLEWSGDPFSATEEVVEGFGPSLRPTRLDRLLSDVMIAHGWGYVCGTAILGGATLCPSTEGLLLPQGYGRGPSTPFTMPAVVGVPFP